MIEILQFLGQLSVFVQGIIVIIFIQLHYKNIAISTALIILTTIFLIFPPVFQIIIFLGTGEFV